MGQGPRDGRHQEEDPGPRPRAGLPSGPLKHKLRDAVQQALPIKLKKVQLQ